MTGAVPNYDEGRLRTELETFPLVRRVAFACSMAECLMPLYEFSVATTGEGAPDILRSSLDLGWTLAASGPVSAAEAEAAREVAEELVPDDQDDNWTLLSPLAQNAAAAVAYALRASLNDDPQEAVWAARQLHEAADYLVQLVEADHSYRVGSSGEPMAIAIEAIESSLASA